MGARSWLKSHSWKAPTLTAYKHPRNPDCKSHFPSPTLNESHFCTRCVTTSLCWWGRLSLPQLLTTLKKYWKARRGLFCVRNDQTWKVFNYNDSETLWRSISLDSKQAAADYLSETGSFYPCGALSERLKPGYNAGGRNNQQQAVTCWHKIYYYQHPRGSGSTVCALEYRRKHIHIATTSFKMCPLPNPSLFEVAMIARKLHTYSFRKTSQQQSSSSNSSWVF